MIDSAWLHFLVRTGKPVLAVLTGVGLLAVWANADEVPIENHSFEEPVLDDGDWDGTVPPGWNGFNSGIQNFTDNEFEGASGNGPLPAPAEGIQAAFMNPDGSELYQHVGQIEAGTEYTLTVAVGNRLDRGDPLEVDMEIILGQDRGGRVLATTTTEAPENGEFEDFSLTYVAQTFDSGDLTIAFFNPGGQAVIDNVRLTAVPDPEADAWQTEFSPLEAPFSLDFGEGQDTEEDLLRVWAEDFVLQADSLRYAPTLVDFISLTALASVENYQERQDFSLQSDFSLVDLINVGETKVGFSVLGGPHIPNESPFNSGQDSGFYGLVWMPARDDQTSALQIREGFSGEILAETIWEGQVPFEGDGIPSILEDFEDVGAVEAAWTTGGTPSDLWEFGEPTTGPENAFEGDNVAATGLDSNYPADADAWLRSPVIDFSEITRAHVSYWEFMELDPDGVSGTTFFHEARVSIVDANDPNNVITVLAQDVDQTDDWRQREFEIIKDEIDGLDGEVVIEFRLLSDSVGGDEFAGWYIDDFSFQGVPDAQSAQYSLHAEGEFDPGGIVTLTLTMTDENDFSDTVSVEVAFPFQGNLFGFGGSGIAAHEPAFDFHNFSVELGDDPLPLDPIINAPFAFPFGSDQDRDPGNEFIRTFNDEWSLAGQALELSPESADYRNSLAVSRVLNFEPGTPFLLESQVTVESIDTGSSENRLGFVLFGAEDQEVFDAADDSTYYTFQWLPDSASGGSVSVRQGMDGSVVAETPFAGVDAPPELVEGGTYTFRFLGTYVGNNLEFTGVVSDGVGGAAVVSGTLPNAPDGNRFGFGARHSDALNPVWAFHNFDWSDSIPLPMPVDVHFGTAPGRQGDQDFVKTGFQPGAWQLEENALLGERADVLTTEDQENASAAVPVFDYTPGLDFAVRSNVTASGDARPTLEFPGDGSRIVTEVTSGDLGISGNNPRTIEAWALTRTFDNNGTVWTMGNHGTVGEDFTLKVMGEEDEWVVNQWGGDGSDVWFNVPNSLNRWVHLAVVHTGEETIVYANGEEVARADREIDTSTEQPFRMGWWQNRAEGSGFDGYIRDVRVWDVIRSQSEIQADMDAELSGNEDGLVAYWPLNEGEGTTAIDQTPNGYDGTFTGPDVETPGEGLFPVANFSFEEPALDDGDWDSGADGWSGSNFGVENPQDGMFDGTTDNGPIPEPGDGVQVLWINNGGEVYQNLGPIAPNAEYTLTVAIGNRLDRSNDDDPLDAEIQIINGSDPSGEVLASTTTSPPPDGEFEDFSATYTTGADVSGNLTIAVVNDTGGQVIIDNVRLEAPEHAMPQIQPVWATEFSPQFGLTFLGDEAGSDSAHTFQWLPFADNGGELRLESPLGESAGISLSDANGAPEYVDGGVYTLLVVGTFDQDGNLSLTGTLSDDNGGSAQVTAEFEEHETLPAGTWFGMTSRHPSVAWRYFQVAETEAGLPDEDPGEPEETDFAEWQEDHFGGETDPNIIGPGANPAGDGIANLLKYAFGLDPMSAVSPADLPQPEVEDGVLQLTYLERRNATDIAYVPEVSLQLSDDWDDQNVEEVPGSRVPMGDFDQVTVRAVVPDGTTRVFLRVNVIQN